MDVLILKFATQLITPIWHHELELLHDMTRDTLHWTKTTEAITALVVVFVVLSRMLRHGRKSSNESKSLLTAGMCLQMFPTTRRTCDVFLLLLETKSGRRLSVTNGVREEGRKR